MVDTDALRKDKCVVIKTSTRQTIFLPVVGGCGFCCSSCLFVFTWALGRFHGPASSLLESSLFENNKSNHQTDSNQIPAGLVDPAKLKPADLVGVNKDSYLILDMLPYEYDSRVKAMEVDEKPTEDYSDVGGTKYTITTKHRYIYVYMYLFIQKIVLKIGLDKQIQELVEAVVRPMTHKHLFEAVGIKPPKGIDLCEWVCNGFVFYTCNFLSFFFQIVGP